MEEFQNRVDGATPRPTKPENDIAQPHPRQAEATALFGQIMKNRRMGIAVNISGIADQLKAAPTQANYIQQFPEQLFVEHFIPLFAGEVQPTPHVNYNTWVEKVAGGENKAVEIVDENGSVLFTVPPMFDTSVLEQSKPGGESMTLIERHYSRLKEFDISGSQNYLRNKLSSMHIREKPTEEVYNNFRAWNAIFERYGRHDKILNLLPLENDPNKDKAGEVNSGHRDDGLTYELDTD